MINYLDMLNQYEQTFGQDDRLSSLKQQILSGENVIDRKNMNGHCTASPFVFNEKMDKVLCIYHASMQRWFQPGGHIDDMIDHPFVHGMRELEEETGVRIARLHDRHLNHQLCPLHIDIQEIPARPEKGEGEHLHYDIQFVCIADESVSLHDGDEGIESSAWKEISELEQRMPYLVNLLQSRILSPSS